MKEKVERNEENGEEEKSEMKKKGESEEEGERKEVVANRWTRAEGGNEAAINKPRKPILKGFQVKTFFIFTVINDNNHNYYLYHSYY